MKLYHFTSAKNLASIRRRGLIPRGSLEDDTSAVWLTLDPERPSPSDRLDDVMLTIEIDETDSRLLLDSDELFAVAEWRLYIGKIPPERIEFPPDDRERLTDEIYECEADDA